MNERDGHPGISRRSFLQAGAGAAVAAWSARAAHAADRAPGRGKRGDVLDASIADLQAGMESGRLTSQRLVGAFRRRILAVERRFDLRSVLELNPDADRIAADRDRERLRSGPRGPLHGIPVLLKDNINTGDRLSTSAGSLALAGAPAPYDARVAARLRAAGAVILGKTNMSEWSNFRGFQGSSGWSGVGGQGRNPHVLDRNPCGSSSGSAAAVAAGLTPAALGTETDGSIVAPAGQCGVVGIKPTVGLTSRTGIVPISFTQDTVGVHARSVADAAAVLGPLTGVDPLDPKTAASEGRSFTDYGQFVDPDGLRGARIGVLRQLTDATAETAAVFEQAVQVMAEAGAVLVDPVDIPTFDAFHDDQSEIVVLLVEFKRQLNAYLATRTGLPVATLADVIQFNRDHADIELAFFGQEWMELAEAEIFGEADYQAALMRGPLLGGRQGIDAALEANGLDALVAPTNTPAWPNDAVNGDALTFGSSGFAAVAGYPLVSVPAGFVFGLPVGITFMAGAFSEPTLIRLAAGFEAAAGAWRPAAFLRSVDAAPRRRRWRAVAARPLERPAARDSLRLPRLRRPRYV